MGAIPTLLEMNYFFFLGCLLWLKNKIFMPSLYYTAFCFRVLFSPFG